MQIHIWQAQWDYQSSPSASNKPKCAGTRGGHGATNAGKQTQGDRRTDCKSSQASSCMEPIFIRYSEQPITESCEGKSLVVPVTTSLERGEASIGYIT